MAITTPNGFRIGACIKEIRGVRSVTLGLNNPVGTTLLPSPVECRAYLSRKDYAQFRAGNRRAGGRKGAHSRNHPENNCALLNINFPHIQLYSNGENWHFNLTVVVLTMNRPHSLARLLRSIEATDFGDLEGEEFFDLEIHVDKSLGLHYEDCVK